MVNKHIKRWATSLVINEGNINWKHNEILLTAFKNGWNGKADNPSVGENVGGKKHNEAKSVVRPVIHSIRSDLKM